MPQAPQLLTSVMVLAQPMPVAVGHMTALPAQLLPHCPVPSHTWPAWQTMPQPPQLALSVSVLTHAVPHRLRPVRHWHAEPEHC
jgi:hypothetical protein